MSVEAILMHFEVIFSCETKLILQALTVFQMLTTAFLAPTINVLIIISTPRWICSGGGIKLDSFQKQQLVILI